MTADQAILLLSAMGVGSGITAMVTSYLSRKDRATDSSVKIVQASDTFTKTVLARLTLVEAKVERLEVENDLLRSQIYSLGHIPLQHPEPEIIVP